MPDSSNSNNKRIIDLPELGNYSDDLYLITEKSGGVTSKIRADKIRPNIDSTLAIDGAAANAKAVGDAIARESAARVAAINKEESNRNTALSNLEGEMQGWTNEEIGNAIDGEVSYRNQAIDQAISTEVTNRNTAIDSAIAGEVSDRNTAIGQAISTEVTNRNTAIEAAIATEVTNRDSAIDDAKTELKSDLEGSKADAIVETASGSIVSFDDGGDDLPMKSLKVNIVPKQSGTGDTSPTNVKPISGWSGVKVGINGGNYFPCFDSVESETKNGITFTVFRDSYGRATKFKLSGTSTSSVSFSFRKAGDRFWLPKGNYKMAIVGDTPSASSIWDIDIRKVGIDRDIVAANGTAFFTLDDDTEFQSAYVWVYANKTINAEFTPTIIRQDETFPTQAGKLPCVELKPYPIPFKDSQGNPITVYGGNINITDGEGEGEMSAPIDLGNLNWEYSSQYDCFSTYGVSALTKQAPKLVCSNYKYVGIFTALVDKSCGYIYGNNICIRDSTYGTDAAAFQAAMQGVQLCYELAASTPIYCEPTEIKSLKGVNNVWADTGDAEAEYRADTTLAFEKLKNAIVSLGGNI